METVILVIHLILAVAIIALVLVQRSSGGGLGIGGSGGMGDFASARGTANTLTKLTTYFAIAFFATSLSLGYIAANNSKSSILDTVTEQSVSDDKAEQTDTSTTPVANTPAEPSVPVSK